MPAREQTMGELIQRRRSELLPQWLRFQLDATTLRRDLMNDTELRQQSERFLTLLQEAVRNGDGADVQGPSWSAEKSRRSAATT